MKPAPEHATARKIDWPQAIVAFCLIVFFLRSTLPALFAHFGSD